MRKSLLIRDIPEVNETNDKEFIVKARVIEEALVVDIFYNSSEIIKKLLIQKNKYETYDYEHGEWNQKKLDNNRYTQQSQYNLSERLCDVDHESEEAIMNFCGRGYFNDNWWNAIERYQDKIRYGKEEKNNVKRKKTLDERKLEVGDEPPFGLSEWMDAMLPRYLFYRKKGRYVTCKCSECGDTYSNKFKRNETYLGQFESIVDNPEKGKQTKCASCGASVTYTPFGREVPKEDKVHGYAFQKYKQVGVVLRYFEMEKKSYVDEGIYSQKGLTEIARVFFHPDENIQKDYHKFNPYSGTCFWDDCNLSGLSNIIIKPGQLMMNTMNCLNGTILQYSGIREYIYQNYSNANIIDYLTKYMKYPVIEKLVKAGLMKLVDNIQDISKYLDINQKRLVDILRIKKERLQLLKDNGASVRLYKILVMEKENNLYIEQNDLLDLYRWGINELQLANILRCMTIKKFINHTKKYITSDVEKFNRCAYRSFSERIANRYADLLGMLIDFGYDTTNTVHIFPNNLKAKHDELALAINAVQNEKDKNAKNSQYPNIETMYEELAEEYFFEKDGLFIRPAMSAAEIVAEGQTLHHCVGGNTYLINHNMGSSIILFIRYVDIPQEPYVTVEYCDGKVKQWYGQKDNKVDKDQNEKFLNAWIKYLNNKLAEQVAS